MVPEGWKNATLGELVRLRRGHDLPAQDRIPGKFQIIGGGGPNGTHNAAKAPAPGAVIGRSGSGIGNAWWSDKPFWPLNTGLYVTDFLENDPWFCFLWLDWIDFSSHNSGGAQPSLNRNFIYPIPLPLPPLPEQKKIAEILSTWDSAIAVAERQLENAKAQKKALMQQLLTGKRRLPGFEGEWKSVKLGEIFSRISRKNNDASDNVLTISGQDGLVSQREYFGKRVAANDLSKYTLLFEGEFAYNKSYSQGYPMGAIKQLQRHSQGVVSSLYICFSISDSKKANSEFFQHWFEAGCLNRQLLGIAQEGARNHGLLNVAIGDFFNLRAELPEINEQHAICNRLSAAETEVSSRAKMLDHLRTEKRALMQQLLTGKKRVKV